MTITRENWKWWLGAFILGFLIPMFRRPIGVVVVILTIPFFYHLFKGDGQASPVSVLLFLAGIFYIWW